MGAQTQTLEKVSYDCTEIESVVKECELQSLGNIGSFEKALKMADGIRRLRTLLTPEMMTNIVQLQDTSLGFRTDKDPKVFKDGRPNEPYGLPIVKDCVIEAMIRGAYVVGNEFNIIAGRAYLTLEFYSRLIGTLPGVSDVRVSPGIPRLQNGGALVRVLVTWKKEGKADQLTDEKGQPGREFAIRVNQFMGADAIIGKAKRKALKAAVEQITGSVSAPDGDVDDVSMIDGEIVGGNGGQSSGVSELNQRAKAAADAPKVDTPKVETPKQDSPKVDPPKQDDAVPAASTPAQTETKTEPVESPKPEPTKEEPPSTSTNPQPAEGGGEPDALEEKNWQTYPGFAHKFLVMATARGHSAEKADRALGGCILNYDVKATRLKSVEARKKILEAVVANKFDFDAGKLEN